MRYTDKVYVNCVNLPIMTRESIVNVPFVKYVTVMTTANLVYIPVLMSKSVERLNFACKVLV